MRVIVGDRFGNVIAELTGELGPVSWRLNEVGKASLIMPRDDPKATEKNLRFGNRVIILFDNGLPNWGGIIDTPRTWDTDGSITATFYSAEQILGYRITDKGRYFDAQTPGGILQALLQEANAIRATGILPGTIGGGSSLHYPDYHFKDLLTILTDSITGRLSDHEFYIEPILSGGVIRFYLSLYSRLGRVKSGVALVEGRNLTDIKLREEGPLVNYWALAGGVTGGGDSWGDDRITAIRENEESIGKYGLRQDSEITPDVVIQATLDANADKNLAETKEPTNLWDLKAISAAPAEYSAYHIGDTVRLFAPSYGFGGTNTTIRLTEREYDPASGFCRIVCEEA